MGCHCLLQIVLETVDKNSVKVKVLVAQWFLTLCDPKDYSLPISSVHGVLQASVLEWVAILFSRESSCPRDQTWVSCIAGRFFTTSTTWRRRRWHPTPVVLPGKSHGQRSLVGCSPSGCEESDTTERLPFHFSLSCIGEGNGNPLQCSCLENPRDGGAWWATVYGITQSRTRLKRLSSSSSRGSAGSSLLCLRFSSCGELGLLFRSGG